VLQDVLVNVPLAQFSTIKDVHASGTQTTLTWWERQQYMMTPHLSLIQTRTIIGLVNRSILGELQALPPFTAHVATMAATQMVVPQETQKAAVVQVEVTDMDRMPGH